MAVTILASEAENIDAVSGAIHDCWFDLDDIVHDLPSSLLTVPFTAPLFGSSDYPPRFGQTRAFRGVLRIEAVKDLKLIDIDGIGWHSFNRLEYDSATRVIAVDSNFPIRFEVEVGGLRIAAEIRYSAEHDHLKDDAWFGVKRKNRHSDRNTMAPLAESRGEPKTAIGAARFPCTIVKLEDGATAIVDTAPELAYFLRDYDNGDSEGSDRLLVLDADRRRMYVRIDRLVAQEIGVYPGAPLTDEDIVARREVAARRRQGRRPGCLSSLLPFPLWK